VAITDLTIGLARELKGVITDQTDQVTRDLVSSWARAWDEIVNSWRDAIWDITTSDLPTITITQAARMERVQAALNHAAGELDRLLGHQTDLSRMAAREILLATQDLAPKMIASQLPATEGSLIQLAIGFGRLNPDAYDAMLTRTLDQITSTAQPLSGSATESMLRALIASIPEGQSPRDTARQMLTGTEDAFNGGLGRALTISRTEILDAYRGASNSIYQANTDVVDQWMWSAELDDATCISCCVMDGEMFPLDESGPDDHQNGRCIAIPVTKSWDELGFTGIAEPDSNYQDAQSWFDGLPEDQQLSIAGPGRLDAYQSGTPWSDLSTTRSTEGWRDSRVPTPVADLVSVE
jgi:hypothetical protein